MTLRHWSACSTPWGSPDSLFHRESSDAGWKVLYDILGSPQSRDLGHDNLEFQVVVRISRDWHATGIATWRPLRESWLALGLSFVSCHDSSLPSKRIWWHIMTQGYLQMYKMMWNCVIGNFIVGKKIAVAVPVRSVCSSSPAMKCGRVRHELLLKTDSLMKTTATQVQSHCQKHMRMSRNYDS